MTDTKGGINIEIIVIIALGLGGSGAIVSFITFICNSEPGKPLPHPVLKKIATVSKVVVKKIGKVKV